MVVTAVIPLNFRWFLLVLQFAVVVQKIQCATDGSPLFLCLLETIHLKKSSVDNFPFFYARTDLHNCLNAFGIETVSASALREQGFCEVLHCMSMKLRKLSDNIASSKRFCKIDKECTCPVPCPLPSTFSGHIDV